VKKKPWQWDSIHQEAFDNVKKTIAQEVVLAYPDFTKPFDIYVAPQIGMNPKPVWGCPRFGILTQTDLGIPVPIWGLAFLVFFSVMHKIAFSHQKLRQSQCHGAPLLAENLGNQPTAPAN
jgi:hypothetical protein